MAWVLLDGAQEVSFVTLFELALHSLAGLLDFDF